MIQMKENQLHGRLVGDEDSFKTKIKDYMDDESDVDDNQSPVCVNLTRAIKNPHKTIYGRVFILKEQISPDFNEMEASSTFKFENQGSSLNGKVFDEEYFATNKRTFFGVYKEQDKMEVHKIKFDHSFYRTIPGKYSVKTITIQSDSRSIIKR